MIPLKSLYFSPSWVGRDSKSKIIDIEPPHAHDIDNSTDKRSRSLKQLIKLNHANHSLLYEDFCSHNLLTHILATSFMLGLGSEKLQRMYEEDSQKLDSWTASPSEVTSHDWRDHIGDRRYQRAYLDYFEDELVTHGYDWNYVVQKYLHDSKSPLIGGLFSGFGYPLVHLGLAYEISSRELAMEAMALAATCSDQSYKLLGRSRNIDPPNHSHTSLLDILTAMRNDARLNGLSLDQKETLVFEELFERHEELIVEYWDLWTIQDAKSQFRESQLVAGLFVSGIQRAYGSHDPLLVRVFTTSHALRVILPHVDGKSQISLLKQWWLFALTVYICRSRPEISEINVRNHDISSKTWEHAIAATLEGQWSREANFISAIHALKEAEALWGRQDDIFLKAAIKFCDQFQGWSEVGVEVSTI